MAVASLRYRPNASLPEESKFGYVVFSGDPVDYHHWCFRTELKFATCKDEDAPRTMREVIENLKGDALAVAIEIGSAALLADTGKKKLIAAMLAHIFPIARHEAKALYKEGHKTSDGVFTKQHGESMQSFIPRRKRWWTLLSQLDTSLSMSSEVKGDILLDSAKLIDWQRQLILTTTRNSTEFAEIEKALMEQLGALH